LLVEDLDIKKLQEVLATCWKPYLKETNIMLEDATCYETSMRYPTNVKLLWESTEWSYYQLRLMCKYLKIRMPRNKYEEQWDKYNNTAISVRGRIKKQPNEPGACYIYWKRY